MNSSTIKTLITVNIVLVLAAVIYLWQTDQLLDENLFPDERVQFEDFYQFEKPRVLEPVNLENMAGDRVSFPQASYTWQLVNFGYMFCPDICPVNLRLLADLKERWNNHHQGISLTISHITFDPERDLPENLIPYLEYHHKDLVGFTGSNESIRKLAKQLNVTYILDKPDEYGNYFIAHSDSIALLNPEGQFVGLFKGPYDIDNVEKVLSHFVK